MVNRLTSEWVDGEVLKAVDLNDTFNAVETLVASEATSRADEDGFIYIDDTTLTTTNSTATTVRTYTINKAVDALIFSTVLRLSTTGNGQMQFFKNSTQILITDIIPLSASYDAANIGVWVDASENGITTSNNSGSNIKIPACNLLNVSFAVGDTLVLKMKTSAGTLTSEKRTLRGIKNKSTDTTWVSVS